ncbi:MAG: hypothetical protein IJA97_00895 [Clostridia bacterium]|nr:hypothetical protein [Clostridia bacterium]
MTYFLFALIALLCWSGSDLFSKMGTAQKDKLSHWRVIFWVGAVMGAHALISIVCSAIFGDALVNAPDFVKSLIFTDIVPMDFIKYLPVAFMYLLAMVIGYAGLRYIELSISSPICNASGSLALLLIVLLGAFGVFAEPSTLSVIDIIAVVFITFGIIWLGVVEYKESDEVKLVRSEGKNFKYTKSFIAILIPIIYLFIDGIATVGDELLFEANSIIPTFFADRDYAANTAFELVSVCFAIFAFLWVKFVKKENMFSIRTEEVLEDGSVKVGKIPFSKFLIYGGICETVGQIFYMAVMASDFVAGIPMISAYCVLSIVWSRIFLKEKLSILHYIAIFATILGIVALGVSEMLIEIGVI